VPTLAFIQRTHTVPYVEVTNTGGRSS